MLLSQIRGYVPLPGACRGSALCDLPSAVDCSCGCQLEAAPGWDEAACGRSRGSSHGGVKRALHLVRITSHKGTWCRSRTQPKTNRRKHSRSGVLLFLWQFGCLAVRPLGLVCHNHIMFDQQCCGHPAVGRPLSMGHPWTPITPLTVNFSPGG